MTDPIKNTAVIVNLEALAAALHARHRHYGTPIEVAEPALNACRLLAKEGRIGEISTVLRLCGQFENAQWITCERLPQIIESEYLVNFLQLDPDVCSTWQRANADWRTQIQEYALHEVGLQNVVHLMVQSVRDFEAVRKRMGERSHG